MARRAERTGFPVAGYKVALTSQETQEALGVDHPLAGRFLTCDIRPSKSSVALGSLFTPLIEAEIVFRFRRNLELPASAEAIRNAADVTAGLECPDSRYSDWFGGEYPALRVGDVVADNCLAGLLIVGDTWQSAKSVDLSDVGVAVHTDTDVVKGSSQHVLGDPLRAVAWLTHHLAQRGGELAEGMVVSSGTLTSPFAASPGYLRAAFTSGLGSVEVEFARS